MTVPGCLSRIHQSNKPPSSNAVQGPQPLPLELLADILQLTIPPPHYNTCLHHSAPHLPSWHCPAVCAVH